MADLIGKGTCLEAGLVGGCKISRFSHTPARILKSVERPLSGFSHGFSLDGLNNIYSLKPESEAMGMVGRQGWGGASNCLVLGQGSN